MATVQIPDQNRVLTESQEIVDFLMPFGISYETWQVDGRLSPTATDAEILSEYAVEIEKVKSDGGYVTADVINVKPDTPNLDAMLQRFNKEHTHSEDEVRFTVEGRGVFHLHPEGGPVFGVTVEKGDLIKVPNGMRHWFNLCDDRNIRCIRFFQDPTGWTPSYVEDAVHARYSPVCFGPNYVSSNERIKSVVDV